ncbi:hypothetical protein CCP2SC5_220012 [Azospirillaceae bacterium]
MADHFYGTIDFIFLCQKKNGNHHLRLKGNLVVLNGEERMMTRHLAEERLFLSGDYGMSHSSCLTLAFFYGL